MQKEIPVVIKLAGVVEINENDPHQITHLKGRMASEINSRTQDKELVVVTCVLNPFTKSLDVLSANECLDGHQMLLKAALNMKPKPVLKVKKEPWISKSQNDSLPTLPVVPDLLQTNQPQTHPPYPRVLLGNQSKCYLIVNLSQKKPELHDIDEWLLDVICIGESLKPV